MPTLTLEDCELPSAWGLQKVYVTMCHPDEARWREELLTILGVQWLEAYATVSDHAMIAFITQHCFNPTIPWRVLRDAPPQAEVLARAGKAHTRGSSAGDILMFMLQIQVGEYPPSVSKAIFLMQEMLTDGQRPAGKGLPASRKEIYKIWGAYKSVAHFWAAFNLVGTSKIDTPSIPAPLDEYRKDRRKWLQTSLMSGRNLPPFLRFLAMADLFRYWGIQKTPGHQHTPTPLLDPMTTWHCKVPGRVPPLAMQIPPPTDAAKNLLENYKANARF